MDEFQPPPIQPYNGRELGVTTAGPLGVHTSWVNSVTHWFSREGQRLATASEDKTVRVWDVESGKCLRVLTGHTRSVNTVTALPTVGQLASGSSDKLIFVWDIAYEGEGARLQVLKGHNGAVYTITPLDDIKVVSGALDGDMRIWNVSTGACLRVLEENRGNVVSITALNSKYLVSTSDHAAIRLWEIASGKCLVRYTEPGPLGGHVNSVNTVISLSGPEGLRFASASYDTTVRIWDALTGVCLRVLNGHTSAVNSLCAWYTPEGQRLASGSSDMTVRLWNVVSGVCIGVFQGYTASVMSVTGWYIHERSFLASASEFLAQVWKLPTVEEERAAEEALAAWEAARNAAEAARKAALPKWKGWTRSDLFFLDNIFNSTNEPLVGMSGVVERPGVKITKADNISICPVCLKYEKRGGGCNYMRHKCSDSGGYYHAELYKKYNEHGLICWCTICGRICYGGGGTHQHYQLGSAKGPIPDKAGWGDPFGDDCRKRAGGGGKIEKLARFRRLREYALELQEYIGKKIAEEAYNELVEATWNAPLYLKRDAEKLQKIYKEKMWNIPEILFPKNEDVVKNEVIKEVTRTPGDIANLGPVEHGEGENFIGEEGTLIEFRHRQYNGALETPEIKNHTDLLITPRTLEGFIENIERTGRCFDTSCKGRLWPDEIDRYITNRKLYDEYKLRFNINNQSLFRTAGEEGGGGGGGAHGGARRILRKLQYGGENEENFFTELTDAECSVPPKSSTGGARNRKTHRYRKNKTRSKKKYRSRKQTLHRSNIMKKNGVIVKK